MRCIAVVNQKGGSGKTTTAVNLAASLVEAGKKVLLVDLDPQGSASLWYGCKEGGKGLLEVFIEDNKLENIIEKTSLDKLHLIPASPVLANVEKTLQGESCVEMILKNKLQNLPSHPWDFVLIDCPPTLGVLSLNALVAASEVLIPVEAHVMALHGLVQLLKTVSMVKQKLNPSLEVLGILPCRVDNRTKHSQEVLQQLKSRFPLQVCKSHIRENIKLAEAPLHHKPITEYDSNSKGAKDYRALAEEILVKQLQNADRQEFCFVEGG